MYHKNGEGFLLIEVMIALMVSVIFLSTLALYFNASLKTHRELLLLQKGIALAQNYINEEKSFNDTRMDTESYIISAVAYENPFSKSLKSKRYKTVLVTVEWTGVRGNKESLQLMSGVLS